MTSNGPYTNIFQTVMIQINIIFKKYYGKHMLCRKIKIEIDKNHNESWKPYVNI
jgi:hypothetical protein